MDTNSKSDFKTDCKTERVLKSLMDSVLGPSKRVNKDLIAPDNQTLSDLDVEIALRVFNILLRPSPYLYIIGDNHRVVSGFAETFAKANSLKQPSYRWLRFSDQTRGLSGIDIIVINSGIRSLKQEEIHANLMFEVHNLRNCKVWHIWRFV